MIDDVAIELPLKKTVCAAIKQQSKAGVEFKVRDPLDNISDILNRSLDPKYLPPSEAQINYAFLIAGALNLMITGETLATKGACHAFISAHVDAFRLSMKGSPAKVPTRKKPGNT